MFKTVELEILPCRLSRRKKSSSPKKSRTDAFYKLAPNENKLSFEILYYASSLVFPMHLNTYETVYRNMDQKSPGNKGSLVYAGIKSIVKSSF